MIHRNAAATSRKDTVIEAIKGPIYQLQLILHPHSNIIYKSNT